MDKERRNFFADYVLQCGRFSERRESKTAIVVGSSEQIIAIGYDAPIINGYNEYPVMMATQHITEEPVSLFLSYFPHVDEFRILVSTKIRTIYFWGEVDDEETAQFLNKYNAVSETPFEIIKLKK